MSFCKNILAYSIIFISGIAFGDQLINIKFPDQSVWLDKTYASLDEKLKIDGENTLHINTDKSKETWTECFKTPAGLLKGGKSYRINFKFKNLKLEDDSYSFFLIRPFGVKNRLSDLGSVKSAEIHGEKAEELSLKVKIPDGRNDYSFQLHTRNHAEVLLGSISIKESDQDIEILLKPDGAAPELKLSIPTGSAEFTVELPQNKDGLCLKAEDFGLRPENPDNCKALSSAIEKCKEQKAAKLQIKQGIYHFTSDEQISFEGLSDFEFDGGGSTFIFLKKKGSLFKITNCERMLFRNLNIDWDWEKDPLASVVELVEIAPDRSYMDLRFVDYQDFPNKSARMAFLDMLDPQTLSVGSEGGFGLSLEFTKGKNKPDTEWLSGNMLRIKESKINNPLREEKLKKGQLFRLSHYYYDINGITMNDNRHLTIQDVNLYSTAGHAFLVYGDQQYWQFIRTNIVRPPNSKRPITCTADHLHIGQSKGFLKIENCEFSLGNDDCLNIHDCSAYGKKENERTISIDNLRSGESYHPGDIIEFRTPNYAPTGIKIAMNKLIRKDGKAFIEFEENIPGAKGDYFILFNRRYDSSNVIVRNSYFHNNRARALLLLGRNITVENNRFFRNQMGAIKIETGYTLDKWCEGYGASNIVIRNNSFDSVNPRATYSNEKNPVIYMSTYLKSDPSSLKSEYPILSDILVENNKFTDCPGAIAYVCSAKNVIIRNNIIDNPLPKLTEFKHRGAVGASNSSEIFVTGNTWINSPYMPMPGLLIDSETVKDAYCWKNILTDKK